MLLFAQPSCFPVFCGVELTAPVPWEREPGWVLARVYEQSKDWNSGCWILCPHYLLLFSRWFRRWRLFKAWARSRHQYAYCLHSEFLTLGDPGLLPLPVPQADANSSYFIKPQHYVQTFIFLCWYNFRVQVGGGKKRLEESRRRQGSILYPKAGWSQLSLWNHGDSVKQNTQSGCGRLRTGLSCLPLRCSRQLQVLRKPSDYPILQQGVHFFFFFSDIGAQSFERISALRI